MKTVIIASFLWLPALASAQSTDHFGLINPDLSEPEIRMPDHTDLITPLLLRENESGGFKPLDAIRNKAGFALAGSAILPGASQAAHGNWFRAGFYLAVEAVTLYAHLEYRKRGIRGERNYERFSDQNWSVVQYANWIVDYHDHNNLSNPYLDALRSMMNGREPAFDTSIDWQAVDIDILRNAERNTPYITTDDQTTNNFSHVLPGYGSQQYYELISKYYQYAAGWSDYYSFHQQEGNNPYLIDRIGGKAPPLFWQGRDMAEEFNDHFRFSNNMLSLLILNHFVSAFDAYFTVRLRNRDVEAAFGGTPDRQFRITYRF